jgi:hypothetical protein
VFHMYTLFLHCSYLNLNMDIFLKTFEKVEFVFHFQTNFDLHIVLNMLVMIQHYVKIPLFDTDIHKTFQCCFQ